MKRNQAQWILLVMFLATVLMLFSCGDKVIRSKADLNYVNGELEKLAPVELNADLSGLKPSDFQVLTRLLEAAKIMDELFMLQVSRDNPAIRAELQQSEDPEDAPYLEMFNIMFGPWNRLVEDHPFINKKEKPDGAGFYPEDMTKEEFLKFIEENPDKKEAFTNTFTVIKRAKTGELTAVPYHEEYADLVDEASCLLNEAAELTKDPTLAKYLKLRARDLLTDDYYESDMAWMDLAGDFEVVIGPYEVYEDQIFSYKAAYEAFICIVDHEESEKLAMVAKYLNELEGALPIPDEYKNLNRGSSSPVKVVQEIFSAGDTKAGIQTTAFNLPNDERVREAKGSKKVMLKNVAQAKYEKCWIPIVNTILAPEPLAHVSFDAYFNHVLMHEVSHGLGPGIITKEDGSKTTVSLELKELYPMIEECKADVLGQYTYIYLMDKGAFPMNKGSAFASYLGGMYRSIRFGIDEAHGGGVAIQFNYFMEKGAFYQDENGKLNLDDTKLIAAIKSLAEELLLIEAHGDYDRGKKLIEQYRVMTPIMADYVAQLSHLPVDIRPSFPIAN
ncbi:peptidase [bacterium]|nr:peptidase [bacterium]MBU1065276.1 peptidase [bacterium]MBU1635845.1 peptidase [bacterium]MBU1874800.1 peptidase [bacterium]